MSRRSLPWSRADNFGDTASKKSSASTRKSSAAFFYPPLTPSISSSSQAMAEPFVPPVIASSAPHPYQLAGLYNTPATPQNYLHPNHVANVTLTSSPERNNGMLPQTQHTNAIQHHIPPPSLMPNLRTPQTQLPDIRTNLRALIFLALFLPIPSILSLLYLIIGHAIFRRSLFSSIPWSATLLSSANAGATGGVILAIPLYLLIFAILFFRISPSHLVHEDFFDDESYDVTAGHAEKYTRYVACAILLLVVGSAAGPLGVTCLAGSKNSVTGLMPDMLTPGRAAKAGIIGALVLWAGVAIILVLAMGSWFFWNWRLIQKARQNGEGSDGRGNGSL